MNLHPPPDPRTLRGASRTLSLAATWRQVNGCRSARTFAAQAGKTTVCPSGIAPRGTSSHDEGQAYADANFRLRHRPNLRPRLLCGRSPSTRLGHEATDLEWAGCDGATRRDRDRSGARAEARRQASRLRSGGCNSITKARPGGTAFAAPRHLLGADRRHRFEVAAGAQIPGAAQSESWAQTRRGDGGGT